MRTISVLGATLVSVLFCHMAISQPGVRTPEIQVYNPDDIPTGGRGSMVARTVLGVTVSMTRSEFPKGATIPMHNDPDESILYVLEGRMKVISGDQEHIVEAGEYIVYPAYVPHSHEYLEDTVTLGAFGPGRVLGGGGPPGGGNNAGGPPPGGRGEPPR